MRLLVFNPENDLALASGAPRYTPTAMVQSLREASALLPAWWAGEDDIILAPPSQQDNAQRMRDLGLNCRIALAEDFARVTDCEPWGWSEPLKNELLRLGVPQSALSTDARLYRTLSHRRWGEVELRRELGLEPAMEVRDSRQLMDIVGSTPDEWVMKSPYSCSGRGVMMLQGKSPAFIRQQADGIIRRQGSLILERLLERRADFAALFDYVPGVGATFVGWSMFLSQNSRYMGNIVCPQSEMERMLSLLVSLDEARGWVIKLERLLTDRLSGLDRHQCIGVDMMALRSGEVYPCVEVNMRRTMGHVALSVADRLKCLQSFPKAMDGQTHYIVKTTLDSPYADSAYPFLDAVSASLVERMVFGDVSADFVARD